MSRRDFSKPTKREAWNRARGICECQLLALAGISGFTLEGCGGRLGPGNTFYEHIIVDRAGGKPTLENCAVLVKTCWQAKTADHDLPKAAKVRRQEDMAASIRGPSRFRRYQQEKQT